MLLTTLSSSGSSFWSFSHLSTSWIRRCNGKLLRRVKEKQASWLLVAVYDNSDLVQRATRTAAFNNAKINQNGTWFWAAVPCPKDAATVAIRELTR